MLWFYSIFLGIELLAVAAMGAVFVFAVLLASRNGMSAALAVGCGGLIPAGFILLVAVVAMSLGQAELAREPAQAGRAARAGFAVLGKRFGSSCILFVLFVVASIAVTVVQMGVSFLLLVAVSGVPFAGVAVQMTLTLLQLLVGAALNLAFAAAFIALYRSEWTLEPETPA